MARSRYLEKTPTKEYKAGKPLGEAHVKVEYPSFVMIDKKTLTTILRQGIPDAEVSIEDLTGTMDHFNLSVRSQAFAGLSRLDQHRLVYAALDVAMKDGRIHALQIKTEVASSDDEAKR